MKGILITAGAALLVAVPAATGLIGNTSFAQSVPVRVPPHAILVSDSDSEHATSSTEPGDDKGGQRATSTSEPGDDKGGQRATSTSEPGDDKGRQRATSTSQPGDDKSGQPATSTAQPHRGTVGDSDTKRGQNGGQGGNINRTGGTDGGSGHT